MTLVVEPTGVIRAIYGEAIDVVLLGKLTVRRASHVEPDASGHWLADLSPVNGPLLGPFERRSRALEAEIDWLISHWLIPDR